MLLCRQSRGRSLQRAAARSRMELSPTRLALGLCCFVGDGGGRRRLTVDGRRSTADARDNVMTKTKTAKAATAVEGGGRRGGSDYRHPLYPCYLSDRDVGRLVVVDGDGAALSWWVGDGRQRWWSTTISAAWWSLASIAAAAASHCSRGRDPAEGGGGGGGGGGGQQKMLW